MGLNKSIIRLVINPQPAVQHSWLYDWQTLVAGVLALIAAGATVYLLWRQIKSDGERETARRVYKLRAARASLPVVLSTICEYAQNAARTMHEAWPAEMRFYPRQPLGVTYRLVADVPVFPEAAIKPLETVLEHVADTTVVSRIESIFREAQVLDVRTREMRTGATLSVRELATYVLEAAVVYARAEILFSFARNHSDTIDPEPLWERVMAALNIMGIDEEAIKAIADEERKLGLPPGEADTLPVR